MLEITNITKEKSHDQFIKTIMSSLGVIPPNHGTSHPVVYENRSKRNIPLNLTVVGN